MEDLHQVGCGGHAVLREAGQAALEHQLDGLVRSEAERGLGRGFEVVAGEGRGRFEEGVDVVDVVGPGVDGADDVEAARGLAEEDAARGGSCGGEGGEGEEGGC